LIDDEYGNESTTIMEKTMWHTATAPAPAGDLGDHPLDVGPAVLVVLAQGGWAAPAARAERKIAS
jgi:hypothetical protein